MGGNKINVKEGFDNEKETELHAVWDYGMIDRIKSDAGYDDWQGYEQAVVKNISSVWGADSETWKQCFSTTSKSKLQQCVEEIAQESLTAACQSAYRDETGQL